MAAIAHAVACHRQSRAPDFVACIAYLFIGLTMFSFFTGLFPGRAKAQAFRSATEAPAAWNEFAGNLRARSEASLRADDEVARRFQIALEKLKSAGGGSPSAMLAVKVWIAPSGHVERVSFAPLADANADADLKILLTRVVADAPPADMLQPIRLKLSLEPRN